MNIFITGVAGFLGSHVADALIAQGHKVAGCDNLIGGYKDNVPQGVKFTNADCLDLEAMNKAMAGCSVVLHTACTAYEGLSVFSPSLVSLNTYQNTATVLTAAVQVGVKKFVHCSSMARYGSQDKLPFTEDMECKPEDPYGIAKYAAELLIRNVCETHSLNYVITVPHNIIGPRQKYDDPFRNVASIMANRMLQGKPPIIYGDGEQKRCFSFISDDVFCLTEAITSDLVNGEVINIGPDEEFVSINELCEIMRDIVKYNGDPIYYPDRPREVKLASCSADKARRLLGYQTKTGLREGLELLVEYIRARGVKPFEYHLPIEIVNEKTPDTWSKRLI